MKNNTTRFSTEQVYLFLRQKLLRMDFKPGQLLSEKEIVSEFKLSRTPVRQALLRMERDGIIEIVPRKGALVKFLSMKDIKEIFQIRKAVEGMAARLAAENRVDPAGLSEYEAFWLEVLGNHSAASVEKIVEVGLKFHNFIIDSAENQRIKKYLKDLRVQLEMIRMFFLNPGRSMVSSTRYRESAEEHVAIIRALKQGDPDLAEGSMRQHIGAAEKYTLSF